MMIKCLCCNALFYRDKGKDEGPVCDTCYDAAREYHDLEIEKECFD